MSRTWTLPGGVGVTRASNGPNPLDPFRYELHTTAGPPVVLNIRDIAKLAEIAGLKPRNLLLDVTDFEESDDE